MPRGEKLAYYRRLRPKRPLKDRFDEKWIGEPNSGCWLWTAACDNDGYGKIGLGTVAEGCEKATRVAWALYCGPIPPQIMVLHKCDTPACVNPNHLFLGTQTDNMQDAARKGRVWRGGSNKKEQILRGGG